MKKRWKQWCFHCNKETRHTREEIKDLVVDGRPVKGAYTGRCENWRSHGQQKKAA